jgi:aldehyde dehydrogenase (NAD+)
MDFTGGNISGRLVGEIAGRNMQHLTCELGGKSPMIVFSDVDLDEAVSGVMFGTFIAAG